MDYTEFEALAKEHGARVPYRGHRSEGEIAFYTEWTAGGECGNSCWGRDPRPVHPDEPSTCIKEFDEFLLKCVPNIGFMQYRVLENKVLKRDTYSSGGDYYGNYYEDAYLEVPIKGLYDALVEMNLISNPDADCGMSM